MNQFEVYTDSGANIPEELVKANQIHIIPFRISIDGVEQSSVVEGVPFEVTAKKFYDEMRNGADVKTSLLSTETFIEALTPTLAAGKDALLITISSGISGTYAQAEEAGKILEQRYPKCKVYVIDGANASMGIGLFALRAAEMRDAGEDAKTCRDWIAKHLYQMNSYLTVGDLKYLKRTGRISTTLALAGTLLNIKPVLRADGGKNAKIVFYSKERGRRRAIQALAEAFRARAIDPQSQRIAIMHADSEEDANELAAMLRPLVKEIVIGYYDLCTGSHVGPGTVALFFMGKDRREEEAEKSRPANPIASLFKR